ncbi:hypothetical protein GCM10022217_09100 [Chryseobacterium ginsenosidimutans]|uniref:hypothetical protein n=1 Tax=Chryseobacterium ginsenosidimutans TaxID=687846 RepID=UPI0031D5ADA3
MGNLKEFVLLFRLPQDYQIEGEQSAMMAQQWKKFIALIASQVKLNSISQLNFDGVIIKNDFSIEHKNFREEGLFVNGTLTMKSETIEDVILVAKKCPVLLAGGTVEIRQTILIS